MKSRASFFAVFALVSLGLSACDSEGECAGDVDCIKTPDASTDAAVDAAKDAGADGSTTCEGPPGLFAEGSCTTLALGIRQYAPAYVLWSDGATKSRYV